MKTKYFIVFGIVLFLGGVIALTSLTSHSYIEKVGDVYVVYTKTSEYKESELTIKRKMLVDLKRDCEREVYSPTDCMNVCEITCGIDMEVIEGVSFEECMEVCEWGCHAEKDVFETQKEINIEIFEGKINEIDEILKIK